MRVGTFSIKIKTYNSKELELGSDYQDINFQLYQKVFYIFFIPVLPLDKFWKVKNVRTNENISMSAELRTKLNLVALKKKNPVWSYMGSVILSAPIVFFLVILMFNIGNNVSNIYQKKNEKKALNSEIINKINHPKLDDVYLMKMIEMDPKTDTHGTILGFKKGYKVNIEYQLINFSNDSIVLQMMKYPEFDGSGLILKKKFNTSKRNLINIADKYKTIDLYKKGTEHNPDLEAIFTIKAINRYDEG